MNNDFFQDYGFLVDDKGLRREFNDIRHNYFLFNNENTGELSEGDSSSGEESEPLGIECGTGATGSSEDDDFHVSIKAFQERDCGCSFGKNGKPCSMSLSFEDILGHRTQCVELTSAELDLVILGTIQSQTKSTSGCKRPRINYFFKGQQVCRTTFQFLYGVGKDRLSNLKKHLRENGLTARRHGNTNHLPHNMLPQEVVTQVVTFIKNFATQRILSVMDTTAREKQALT